MLLKKLGKYEIIQWLGGGRFGDVFLGRDTIIDKNFALKIARMRREEITMLKDEAMLLASLDHPNIVRFYNIDFIENNFVLVMEFVKGCNLRDIIREGGIDIVRSIDYFTRIVDALAYAHGCKVLHRDLKPENILIAGENGVGPVKVTDFGLAKFIRAGSISASSAGTPIYMAPESWSGSYSDRSDVWSLGVIMYELLTGAPPFLDDSLDGLRKKIEKASLVAPTVMRRDIPEKIESIVCAALARDPASRPETRTIMGRLKEMEKGIPGRSVRMPAARPEEIVLTPAQKEVIASLEGPVLVYGQAGCGKTSTLTRSVGALLDKGVRSSKILACTFTNRAANDIRERLQKSRRPDLEDLWLGTVHTMGFRILRRDAERLDIDPDFVIKDARTIVQEIGVEVGKYRINPVLRFIEGHKAKGLSARLCEPTSDWENACCDIYRQYEAYTRQHSILDYDDLILLSKTLLEENRDIREYYRDMFDYIFVDELQDINPAQYALIKLIYRKNIFFTGDADQAIYGWRGAQRDLLYRVPEDFPEVRVFQLNQSFRLGRSIIDIANNLMQREATAIPAGLSEDVTVHAARSERDEAGYVVREIAELHEKDFAYRDMVILCRMNQLCHTYEQALAKAAIPHALISGGSLHDRGDVKPIIEYLEALNECASNRRAPEEFLGRAASILDVDPRSAGRSKEVWSYHLANPGMLEPKKLIDDIVDLTGITSPGVDELKDLAAAEQGTTLIDFLNRVRLVQELDLAQWNTDVVRVMTVHSAKGLEFPVVFVVDLAEDVFPVTGKISVQRELDEERRLCYVAVTRAQKLLYLLFPKRRRGRNAHPSRFLIEMFKTSA